MKITATVKVYDKNYRHIATKKLDSYSTYEVCDDLPYSGLASRRQAIDAILDDLAHSIIFAIISSIKPT
jgi:hypothetical protein